jgi:hypothetical protein
MKKGKATKRNLLTELVEGVDAMRAQREGKMTLRTRRSRAIGGRVRGRCAWAPGAKYCAPFIALFAMSGRGRPIPGFMLGQASPLAAHIRRARHPLPGYESNACSPFPGASRVRRANPAPEPDRPPSVRSLASGTRPAVPSVSGRASGSRLGALARGGCLLLD